MDKTDPQTDWDTGPQVSPTGAKRGGEPGADPLLDDSAAAVGASAKGDVTELDRPYHIQLTAKDALIAELRQRLERAEQALVVAGRTEATSEPAGARPESDALGNAAMHLLIAKLDRLYAERIAAKDGQIAAQSELIAELRRRAEYAEQQAATVWEHEALAEPRVVAAHPQQTTLQRPIEEERSGATAVSVRQPAAGAVVARNERPSRARRYRLGVLIAPVAAIILVGVVLSHVFARGAPTGPQGRALRPTFTHFTPIAGLPLPVIDVLAQNVGLVGPRKAVPLPTGQIAVADTGNHRLVLLDHAGHLVASVRAGGLQQPVAIVAASGSLYVLDAARGAIERYDTAGRYVGEIIHDPALVGGRGMAMSQGGLLYVANPRLNGLVVLSARGKILYRITSPRGPGKGQFDAPADVAVGPGGNLYVADSANNRIQMLSPSGTFMTQWPAPPSTAQQAVQLVPLPDGRVLATDPAGGLLVYAPDSALPVIRRPLQAPAGGLSGLAPRTGRTMLVTDGRGNRLLVVLLPH